MQNIDWTFTYLDTERCKNQLMMFFVWSIPFLIDWIYTFCKQDVIDDLYMIYLHLIDWTYT